MPALIIPVLNIPEDDYPLKTEVVQALRRTAGVGRDELIFVDQLLPQSSPPSLLLEDGALAELSRAGKLRITLVDHHLPVGLFAALQRDVEEIIDHHSVIPGRETEFIQ